MRISKSIFWYLMLLVLVGPISPGKADALLPEEARVEGVLGHAQAFSLSCESRSAADWAAYWGVYIDESRFLRTLPRSDNPQVGFVGNPRSPWGQTPPSAYGVHAEPVAALLREYGLAARAQRGLTWDALRAEIAGGRPVIVWVIGQMWPGRSQVYTAADGQTVQVAPFEHTMILVGYNARRVQVVDAYTGRDQSYPVEVFLESWSVLGNMAITAEPGPTSEVQSNEVEIEAPLPTVDSLPAAEVAYPPDGNPAEPTSTRGDLTRNYSQYLALVVNGMQVQETQPALEAEPPRVYIVRRGDYLIDISRRMDVNWRTLAQLNGLAPPYWLHTGQVLRLR